MGNKPSPGTSLLGIVTDKDSTKIMNALLMTHLQREISDGIVTSIPALDIFLKSLSSFLNVRDFLFRKKLVLFLESTNKVNKKTKENFQREMHESSEFCETVGTHLILVLDIFNEIEKARILGNFFNAYLEGKISYNDFRKLSKSLEIISISTIPNLEKFYDTNNDQHDQTISNLDFIDSYSMQEMINASLVKSERGFLAPEGTISGCTKNELGRLFIENKDL